MTPSRPRQIDWDSRQCRLPHDDNSHCRAGQRDRVLTGVKARRYAPPPLRGAAALTPAPRTVTDLFARQTRNISSRKEAIHESTLTEPVARSSTGP